MVHHDLRESERTWKAMTVESLKSIPLLQRDKFGWSAVHWAARCSTRDVLVSIREQLFKKHLTNALFENEFARAAGPSFQQLAPIHLAIMFNKSGDGAEVVQWILLNCVCPVTDALELQRLARAHKNAHALSALTASMPSAFARPPRSPALRVGAPAHRTDPGPGHLSSRGSTQTGTQFRNKPSSYVFVIAALVAVTAISLSCSLPRHLAMQSLTPLTALCSDVFVWPMVNGTRTSDCKAVLTVLTSRGPSAASASVPMQIMSAPTPAMPPSPAVARGIDAASFETARTRIISAAASLLGNASFETARTRIISAAAYLLGNALCFNIGSVIWTSCDADQEQDSFLCFVGNTLCFDLESMIWASCEANPKQRSLLTATATSHEVSAAAFAQASAIFVTVFRVAKSLSRIARGLFQPPYVPFQA